jgi:urocanate hydratase
MFMGEKDREELEKSRELHSGNKLSYSTCWDSEAAIRMMLNNINPDVAIDWENLIVYGGSGRVARNWKEFHRIIKALKELNEDETLCVQSGKPVYIAKTFEHAPRVIIANSNIVPAWATQENFDKYDAMGLTMYGQMTAGSWIYIGTQGILQGTYETFAACAKKHFGTDSLKGKIVLTAGLGGMGSAQPLAITMNEGLALIIEVNPKRAEEQVKKGWCDKIFYDFNDALKYAEKYKKEKKPASIAIVGNAAHILPCLVFANFTPDIVTDQTPAHDLSAYVPPGDFNEMIKLRAKNIQKYKEKSKWAIKEHCEAIINMQKEGAIAFDYGNNLRGQAEKGDSVVRDKRGEFLYPGFVPAYIRPLFCQGKGPFRWAALSADPRDIDVLDKELLKMFPKDKALARWIKLAGEKVPFQGIPARVCWLGYGDRAKFGLKINELVGNGTLKAPIVIGRDHLDCGSVASPNRETEGMKDGSDAIGDWPLINFALNTACGASWVSFHHGGGVGIGNSLHAGMVIVADGTKEKVKRIERVMTVDPGIGIARHIDAGYDEAKKVAKEKNVKIPR